MLPVGPVHRILGESVLETHHPAALEPHLPVTRVAGEERDVAAGIAELLDRVTHRPTPVLVVTDAEVEAVAVEQRRLLFDIGVRREVEVDAGCGGPRREPTLLPGPPGHPVPHAEAVR